MTDKPTYRKLPDDECIGEEMMYRYIDGKLNSADMHKVEAHTLECGLCADALEGLEKVKERDRKGGYFRLPEGVTTGNAGKVISLWSRPALYYSAAACILLFVGFFTLRNFISNDTGKESPNIAAANPQNRFNPEKNDAAAQDSIALPDNRKIAVHDLEESLRADSTKRITDKDKPAENEGPSGNLASNTEASGGDALKDPAVDIPNNIAQDDQPKTTTTVTMDRTENTTLNSEHYYNTTNQTAVVVDLKKNKDDISTDNRASTAPTAASGTASTKAADMGDSQVAISNTEGTNDEVSSTVTNADVMNTSGMSYPAGDTVTVYSAQQTQPNLHPNQETDADVDLSYASGLKMLAQNNPQGSLVFFDDVIAHPSNSHYQDAEWKKAEALIQLGKTDDAKTLLNKIVSEGGKYKTQAQDKLKTL